MEEISKGEKMKQEIVNKIKELRLNGKKGKEVAEILGINIYSVYYWEDDEKRKKQIRKQVDIFKNKNLEQRRKIYERRKEYNKNYQRTKYQNDPEFRKRQIERVKRK